MKRLLVLGILLSGVFLFSISEAVQTKLVVRAKSKDAKFVGTKMGGALVIIKESETGKVLVKGLTAGETGDTGKIMKAPKTRFGHIADGVAGFETAIDISEPTLITIDVLAPYMHKDNLIKSSTQMWLIPGKDITGEGIIIEVPGFSVDARAPESAKLANGKAVIPVQARIVMIWGCVLTPGGLWDSSKYEIKALIKHEGNITGSVAMNFAGPSTFQGEATVSKKGDYEIIVYSYDPQTGNTGVDKVNVKVN